MTDEEMRVLLAALKPILLKQLKESKDFKGAPGTVGSEGPPGAEGKPGRDGQKGDQGPVGAKGPVGPPGDRGAQGPLGPPGPDGPVGEEGPQGPRGETGPRGQAGTDGAPGQRGYQGFAGPVGARGRDGEPGAPGISGANYSCRAMCKDALTINPNEWTIIQFNMDVNRDGYWDSGSFHAPTSNSQLLTVMMAGIYYVSANVNGVDKIKIVHISEGTGKETPIAIGKDSCSTLWKASQRDKFRVEVFCNDTWGIQPNAASPVFLIQKQDKTG